MMISSSKASSGPNSPIFRLHHDGLQKYLPAARFSSLDPCNFEDALTTVARCLCAHGGHDYDRIRSTLSRSFGEASAKGFLAHSPVQILTSVRTWALTTLGDDALVAALSQPLDFTPIREEATFPTKTKVSRAVLAHQARGILSNAFLGNVLDPMAPSKDEWNLGGLDFREMLAAARNAPEGIEKMKCLLVYFDSCIDIQGSDDDERMIEFERVRFKPLDLKVAISQRSRESLPEDTKRAIDRFVGEGVTLHRNAMESSPGRASGFVNFANPNFCYGRFIASCTQEEILTVCCPEITVGMLFVGKMSDDEIVNVRNVRRYCSYSGYLSSFCCDGRLQGIPFGGCVQTIITMDACYSGHFSRRNIERDVSKAFYAFGEFAESQSRPSERQIAPSDNGAPLLVSTGKWGCGAFGGLTAHKMMQQALAANMAGVDLDFSAYGGTERCDEILKAMRDAEPSSFQVQKLLLSCTERRTFVEDALSFLSKNGLDAPGGGEEDGIVARLQSAIARFSEAV